MQNMHQEGFYIFSRFAHTKNMESQKMQALRLSLEIGAAMMESGGEVRRTEDTVTGSIMPPVPQMPRCGLCRAYSPSR